MNVLTTTKLIMIFVYPKFSSAYKTKQVPNKPLRLRRHLVYKPHQRDTMELR